MTEPSDDTRGAITRAVDLLDAAITAETAETYCRGSTVAAMAVALGTLRLLLGITGVEVPRRAAGAELDWVRLGHAVRDRRHWLDMSQGDVSRAGGPSGETQRRIELALRTRYDFRTLTRLERALRWPPGTAAAILAGTAGDQRELIAHDRTGR